MVNIADNNDKLKKDVEKLTQEMKKKDLEIEKLYQENKKQSQDIENLEERVGFLEEDCENLKDTINKIKFRDLSKNFLKCFNQYLTNEDLEFIKDNKDLRGEIISNRIGILYPNDDKEKMKVIKNWVKSSSDLINEGNCLSHSITISEYENKIEYYKQEKNLEQVK
jgi:predicted nuclease with TOPRIM domain